jgi:hypothetical protein
MREQQLQFYSKNYLFYYTLTAFIMLYQIETFICLLIQICSFVVDEN